MKLINQNICNLTLATVFPKLRICLFGFRFFVCCLFVFCFIFVFVSFLLVWCFCFVFVLFFLFYTLVEM